MPGTGCGTPSARVATRCMRREEELWSDLAAQGVAADLAVPLRPGPAEGGRAAVGPRGAPARPSARSEAQASDGEVPLPTWPGRIRGRDLRHGARRRPSPRRLHPLLHRARPHARALGQPHPPRSLGAVHHRRHGAVQALLPRGRSAPVASGHVGPEMLPDRGHRRGRAPPNATAPSSRCWATSASATTSSPRPSPSPGSWSPRSSASTVTGCGSPCSRATTRPSRSGAMPSGSPPSGSSDLATTTSGRWGTPARAAPARSSSSTRDPATATTGGRRSAGRSGSWRSGTWSSCSTTATPTGPLDDLPRPSIDTGAGLERILPVIQGADSIFATDLFLPMIETAQSITGHTYGDDDRCRRRPADPGRPRTGHVHAGGRRGAAGQRGPGLRAPPDHPPGGPPGPPAGVRRAGDAEAGRCRRRASSASAYPALAEQHHLDTGRRRARGGGIPPHAGHRVHHPRGGVGLGRGGGLRRPGLPPARHLRVPGGAHRRDRRGGRGVGRPGGFRGGHGRAAHPGPGGRPGRQDPGRRAGLPLGARHRGPDGVRGPAARRLLGSGPGGGRAGRPGSRPRRARPRSSSTGPPSTPRAAARSATPAPS